MLGGLLTQHVSWEWIFWINVPVGIATMALGAWAITESREPEARRLDLGGLVLSTASLFALTWALIEGHDRGWTSAGILGAFGVAAATALAFVLVERRVAQPMVDVSLFARREFSGGIVALMLWAFGLFGIYFFTSLYLQGVLGLLADQGRRRVRADGRPDGRARRSCPTASPPGSAPTARPASGCW